MIKKFFKLVYWRLQSKSFASFGSNVCMAINTKIIGNKFISIGDNFSAGKNLKLQAWESYKGKKLDHDPTIIIRENVSFMSNCQISCANYIEIGKGTLFGDNVFITDNYHGNQTIDELIKPPLERSLDVKEPIIIGENVWIGRNVCIMPGVSIGKSSIIGANAVVTHDIPPMSVAVGVPAKVLERKRK